MIRSAAALILLLALQGMASAAETLFAVALTDTPVLNTPDFAAVFGGKDGRTLRQDSCGQLRSLEFIALPGTVFTVEAELSSGTERIFRVTTADYPYPSAKGYFIDSRFVRPEKVRPPERAAVLPAREEIIAALKSRTGSRYVWGGNRADGIARLLSWYPPAGRGPLGTADKTLWTLAGVDCSGLLYEATGGFTPRNTSALIGFGKGVPVKGKGLQEIAAALQPLDLLVWPGHVLIVIDNGNIIESHLVCKSPDKGVRVRPVHEALQEIMQRRTAVDAVSNGGKEFVVRRWYGVGE